jgi:hypothetical protein
MKEERARFCWQMVSYEGGKDQILLTDGKLWRRKGPDSADYKQNISMVICDTYLPGHWNHSVLLNAWSTVFCKSLFVLLSLFWQFYCMSFFDIWLLICPSGIFKLFFFGISGFKLSSCALCWKITKLWRRKGPDSADRW